MIKDIRINIDLNWRRIITGRFNTLKKDLPYYDQANGLLNEILNMRSDLLIDLLEHSLHLTANFLNISTNLTKQSEVCAQVHSGLNLGPGQWALELCKQLERFFVIYLKNS